MQTKRNPARRNFWETGMWFLIPSVLMGAGILTGCILFFGVLLLLADAADWMVLVMAVLSLWAAGYGMGRFAGFHRRQKGILTGLWCAGTLYLLLLLIGVTWQESTGGLIRPAVLMLSSVWGGISGVNAPHRKPPK